MKKFSFILTILAAMLYTNSFSQGAYASFGLGYAASTTSDVMGYDETNGDIKNIYGTLGKGFNVNGALGYMFNDNIGAELGLSYLLGSKVTVNETDNFEEVRYTRQFRVIPTMVITTANEGMNIYGKFGVVLPVIGKTFGEGSDANGDIVGKYETVGKLSFGFQGSVGLSYPLNDMLSLWGELQVINLKIRSKETEIFDADGESLLTIKYVDENPENDEGLRVASPYSSIGLNVGLKYHF